MKRLKKCIITQCIHEFKLNRELKNSHLPSAGDVAIFKVKKLGKHTKMQLIGGRLRHIFPGDHILATFGNRYATGQFEGYVPDKQVEEYHILGQGGAVGVMHSSHSKWNRVGVTTLELVGYATNEKGQILNTKFYGETIQPFNPNNQLPFKTILSVGASMDSGKTTTAAYLARGLSLAGKRVVFMKLTGTVYTKDKEFVEDCGAQAVLDFSDLGFPSTYMCSREELLSLYSTLLKKLASNQPDYVVIEIADGLLQRETNMLLYHSAFMDTIDHVILSCGDSLGVPFGVEMLTGIGHRPFALSGLFTASPLLRVEAEQYCNIPTLTLADLQNEIALAGVLRPSIHALTS